MIRLVIKGGVKKAHATARRRGISLSRCRRGRRGAVYCSAPCNKHRAVAKWFGADARKTAPYRAGTLLHYTDRCPAGSFRGARKRRRRRR